MYCIEHQQLVSISQTDNTLWYVLRFCCCHFVLFLKVFVVPKCGRMVGFSAGKENMHGVTAVTKGKRCAVALWFTQDPNYEETAHLQAQTILKQANAS